MIHFNTNTRQAQVFSIFQRPTQTATGWPFGNIFPVSLTELRQREENNQAHQQEYEQRQQQWEEHRRIEEERQARIEEELAIKYRQQEEELRRRQEENRQFMQVRAEGDASEGNQLTLTRARVQVAQ